MLLHAISKVSFSPTPLQVQLQLLMYAPMEAHTANSYNIIMLCNLKSGQIEHVK